MPVAGAASRHRDTVIASPDTDSVCVPTGSSCSDEQSERARATSLAGTDHALRLNHSMMNEQLASSSWRTTFTAIFFPRRLLDPRYADHMVQFLQVV